MRFGLVKVGHGRGMRVRGRGAQLKPLGKLGCYHQWELARKALRICISS